MDSDCYHHTSFLVSVIPTHYFTQLGFIFIIEYHELSSYIDIRFLRIDWLHISAGILINCGFLFRVVLFSVKYAVCNRDMWKIVLSLYIVRFIVKWPP